MWVVYGLPLLAVAFLGISLYRSITSYDAQSPHIQRSKLLEELERDHERHVILVKYSPSRANYPDFEWVYNEADIDAAKVVWARDMDLAKNCELINYFNDRLSWSLEIDRDGAPVQLKRFPSQICR